MYELEVRNQAEALEKQLRRGAYRDSLVDTALVHTHPDLCTHTVRQ